MKMLDENNNLPQEVELDEVAPLDSLKLIVLCFETNINDYKKSLESKYDSYTYISQRSKANRTRVIDKANALIEIVRQSDFTSSPEFLVQQLQILKVTIKYHPVVKFIDGYLIDGFKDTELSDIIDSVIKDLSRCDGYVSKLKNKDNEIIKLKEDVTQLEEQYDLVTKEKFQLENDKLDLLNKNTVLQNQNTELKQDIKVLKNEFEVFKLSSIKRDEKLDKVIELVMRQNSGGNQQENRNDPSVNFF
jgi:hypothetical protein